MKLRNLLSCLFLGITLCATPAIADKPANGAPASEWVEYFKTLPPNTPLEFTATEEIKTVDSKGASGKSQAEKDAKLNLNNTEPTVNIDDVTGSGGSNKSDASSISLGNTKLNIFQILGGFIILASVAVIMFVPVAKKEALLGIILGVVSIAIGTLVANPLYALGVICIGGASLFVYLAHKYGAVKSAKDALIDGIGTAPRLLQDEVLPYIAGQATPTDKIVIERASVANGNPINLTNVSN